MLIDVKNKENFDPKMVFKTTSFIVFFLFLSNCVTPQGKTYLIKTRTDDNKDDHEGTEIGQKHSDYSNHRELMANMARLWLKKNKKKYEKKDEKYDINDIYDMYDNMNKDKKDKKKDNHYKNKDKKDKNRGKTPKNKGKTKD